MEDLLKNDATFDIEHSSLDGIRDCTNWYRTLMSYPSEKSSFQVDLGFDGYSNSEHKEEQLKTAEGDSKNKEEQLKTAEGDSKKGNYDPEKVAGAITSGATALSSVVTTVQAFKNPNKQPTRRKQLKDVCGKKPLLKKNRGTYDKCVADYNAGKLGGNTNTKEPNSGSDSNNNTPPPPPTDNKKRNIIIGLVIAGVLVTAFIGYKKGWFSKKAG
jgi:hypothetical protein